MTSPRPGRYEPENPSRIYHTMLLAGYAGLIILVVGLVTFLATSPPGRHTALHTDASVYTYDPASSSIKGEPQQHFPAGQEFAGLVSWETLPAATTVGAKWYGALQQVEGSVGPARAGELAAAAKPVPVRSSQTATPLLPGRHTLMILRYSGGLPLEIVGRTSVIVDRYR
ncbi:MAG: hypothetical protein M3Y62_04795 [Candidatus Dormibacteraeota bacterium]|nr:hypothetical protein [Candidatus Dormibacteraeota bacterium]